VVDYRKLVIFSAMSRPCRVAGMICVTLVFFGGYKFVKIHHCLYAPGPAQRLQNTESARVVSLKSRNMEPLFPTKS